MPYNNCELDICKFRNGGEMAGRRKCLAFVCTIRKRPCTIIFYVPLQCSGGTRIVFVGASRAQNAYQRGQKTQNIAKNV